MAASIGWKRFSCKIAEIRLDKTLACGQSFRWKETEPGVFTGVIGNSVWQLRQSDTEMFYKVYHTQVQTIQLVSIKREALEKEICEKKECKDVKVIKSGMKPKASIKKESVNDVPTEGLTENGGYSNKMPSFKCMQEEDVLKDYLQLNVKLEPLYKVWAKDDKHFEEISKSFTGIRMLRQHPVECLFSFICSSNNNISRITSMVEKLASHYGDRIETLEGREYFMFPRVTALAQDGVEEKLRDLGFGYRAKYIQKSAKMIEELGGEDWLFSLRHLEYKDAKANLMKLCGVGAKVADCVALMCLDKPGAIPVDTHVWQIAARDYMPKLKQAKSLTEKLYDEIGNYFRELWGPYAGWAHSVLFTADLRQFKKKPESLEQPSEDTKEFGVSPAKKKKLGSKN